MEFSEKFIDENIALLAQHYDCIHGQNVNISRISPDFIDGLKPVQRRALYVMFLKDGGKTFRKLASITGDTFGKVHPHSPTAISGAVVNIAQPWHNSIPLVTGEGNWGDCHDDQTKILTKDGWKYFKDLTEDDELASVNPEDQTLIFEKPVRLIGYEYEGKLIHASHHSLDFAVTPNHKMLVSTYDEHKAKFGKFEFIKAIDLPSCSKVMTLGKEIVIDKSEHIQEIPYKGMVYCAEVPTYHTLVTMRHGKILISGNCSGSRAGADRYIKAKLSDYAIACFFEDWKDSVVDMEMAYDEETMMPLYLPAKYPNVLINGCLGIGYGSSSNICCFNFREVVEATILLMSHPKANIVLIPDSPTGADIIEQDFAKLCNAGVGSYKQRATYEIDADKNMITITSLPDLTTANQICERIADIKNENRFQELLNMNDLSGVTIKIELELRDTANPYKFIKKLFKEVPGLIRTYPINITVVNDYENKDYSIKDLLVEWIKWRRDQKRSVVNNKRAKLMAEQRTNDVKIFIMNPKNLEETIKIFRTSRNREEIEKKLIDRYHNTEIQMDSLQARALSNMRMIELTIEAYEGCLKRAEELKAELDDLEVLLNTENGIDKLIVAELRDGLKRFGTPRKSNVVPDKIDTKNEVEGNCILQLSSDGMILRKQATNAEEEPIPNDSNGFACLVDNDSSFIIITETGAHSFIKVNDIPLDTELPVARYARKEIDGKRIIALLPIDMDKDLCVSLISSKGIAKRIRILDIKSSSRNLMTLHEDDKIVRGIVMPSNSKKELLVYTNNGMGQRVSVGDIRITSPNANGIEYFKIAKDDEIVGVYAITPSQNQYLLYVTVKAKTRLNNISFLPLRNSKHDKMVRLINLSQRDKLLAVIGCNKLDKVQMFFNDGDTEIVDINKMKESTMGEEPVKLVKKNIVSASVVKVKLI